MAEEQKEPNPIDQLVDLFVYAPVGLLYEYEEVFPKLVKRGKSQVQLARVVGQLALRGRRASVDLDDVAGVAGTLLNRAITEFGTMVGLAPDQQAAARPDAPPPPAPPPPPPPAPMAEIEATDDADDADDADESDAAEDEPASRPLPIANYDDLTAREIIPLLDALSDEQRETIRAHEASSRSRKTVLAKLDRLDR
jgi:hypothetical protein